MIGPGSDNNEVFKKSQKRHRVTFGFKILPYLISPPDKKIAKIVNRRVLNIPDVGVNMHNVTSVVPKRFDILWKSYIVLDVP